MASCLEWGSTPLSSRRTCYACGRPPTNGEDPWPRITRVGVLCSARFASRWPRIAPVRSKTSSPRASSLYPRASCRGGRRFPFPAKPLWVFTMGANVVLSCHPERATWVRANLGHLDRDAIFSGPAIGLLAHYVARDGQDLGGPDLKYSCSRDDLRPVSAPDGITITVVEGNDVADLYTTRRPYRIFAHARWPSAWAIGQPGPNYSSGTIVLQCCPVSSRLEKRRVIRRGITR